MNMLHGATILLAAAIIVVTITRKLGFGSVVGYILAGMLIGPWGLNLVSNARSILGFSEVGVVLLLFVIGLEMKPTRLWTLRTSIFGWGSAQLITTTLLLMGISRLFIDSWVTAGVIGFGLALSSTAFALPLIAERKKLASPYGRSALHILLFQDLAAIPALAIIPMIAIAQPTSMLEVARDIASTIGILVAFWLFARYLLRPILRVVAAVRIHEIFISAALLLVLGSALLMQSIGISMALGAFLAGVLVADSEYRYQLESDIEPFKGLLLGLFFIAVGMTANLGLLVDETAVVALIAAVIVSCKALLLVLIGRLAKLSTTQALLLAVYLSQGGEFGFILFAAASKYQLITSDVSDLLTIAITLSMVTTPILLFIVERLIKHRQAIGPSLEYDLINTAEPKVIVAGFGRFGQIIARILHTQGIPFTAIESDPVHVDFVRQLGNKVYYGDASQKNLLDTAGMGTAEVFVLALDDVETSVKIAAMIRRHYPDIRIFARARNRRHEMRLRELGVEVTIRDTLLSSMYLAEHVLQFAGLTEQQAASVKERFYRHDAQTLDRQVAYLSDHELLMKSQRDALRELEELFAQDQVHFPDAKPDSE